MKIKFFSLSAIIFCVFWFLPLQAVDHVAVEHGRKMPIYNCGEKAVFELTAFDNGKVAAAGKYQAEFLFCGRRAIKKIPIDFLKNNPVKLEISLDEPGFVLMKLLDENGVGVKFNKRSVLAGAAFEPEKIRKGYDLPEDFAAFWENSRRILKNVPVELKRSEKYSNENYTTYYISVKSLNDETISGFLSIPCRKGKFPVFVTVPGAGHGISGPTRIVDKKDVITLSVNVHKFPTSENTEEQKRRYLDDAKKGYYPYRGAGDRDKFFYRSVYAGIDHMINYVVSLDEFDRQHLVVEGTSQGGGSALILAGLNKNITALAANVPALCDHGAYKLGRQGGWPMLSSRPQADLFAPYFDAANFASLINIPALVSCGFIDTTCSPSSVYAAFNELKGEKKMINVPMEGHTSSMLYQREMRAFVNKYLGFK